MVDKLNDYGIPVTRFHPLRSTYDQLIARCKLPNSQHYNMYGGRGIKVCERWSEPHGQGFWNFVNDMGPKPAGNYSVDRIDNNGDYSPDNCRWATRAEQARNTRGNAEIVGVIKHQGGWRAVLYKDGVSYRRLFKNKEEAIKQRLEWENGNFDNITKNGG